MNIPYSNILRFATVVLLALILLQQCGKLGTAKDAIDKNEMYEDVVKMVKGDFQSKLDQQDAKIKELLQKDSILQLQIKPVNDRIIKIPVRVNALPDDELYREITEAIGQ